MVHTVGVGQLVEDTGEAPRTLQHWSDLSILRPLPATNKRGRGHHREFSAEPHHGERAWALVASALSKLRIPLGELRRIVDTLRPRIGSYPLYQALTTENDVLLLVKVDLASDKAASTGIEKDAGTGVYLQLSPPLTPEMFEHLESGFIARSPSAEEVLANQIRFTKELGGQAHLLNLTQVFKPLRG